MRLSFHVDGTPIPQGSKTVGRTKTGSSYVREDNPALTPWRNAVAAGARRAAEQAQLTQPLSGPIHLEATFLLARPRAHYRTGKHSHQLRPGAPRYRDRLPDLDKLIRALADSLTGILIVDDAQIADIEASKIYGRPGLAVTISEITVSPVQHYEPIPSAERILAQP